MHPALFSLTRRSQKKPLRLENGSQVAVVGGGPSGSLFGYFLLDLAQRMDIDVKVDIYEPRDFSLPAPRGCNMCAGVISETLVQNLAIEGINLPATVIQNAVNSYVLHTEAGNQQINAMLDEKRIGAIFRGGGPHGIQENKLNSFDDYLLSLAKNKGANIIRSRVIGIEKLDNFVQVQTPSSTIKGYHLLAVAAGVNTSVLKLFTDENFGYSPPRTTKTAIREYFLGRETVEKALGNSLHVFLLDIPRLDFGLIVPKGDYVSICLLGKDIDETLLQDFLTAPAVRDCFPDGWHWDQPVCQCLPRANIHPAIHPYADRIVFIGDSCVTRLYKDGLGAAYRAAKAAAACAVLEGVSSNDFQRFYEPYCKSVQIDNRYGYFIFMVIHILQRMGFARQALLRMMADEQLSSGKPHRMSGVIWDTFTGSAPYKDIFLRSIHPALLTCFVLGLVGSLIGD